MARYRPTLPEDVQRLVEMIRTGRLFALQYWIRSGKQIHNPGTSDGRARLLRIAVETGFHSVLDELLNAGGWDSGELTEALTWALDRRRFDLAELLLAHGAKISDVDFETVCRTVDLGLMEQFLREGGNPSRDNAFAHALRGIKARPLLRFYRSFRGEFPCLEDQAALALYDAVANEQVRWTALLAWAGADPFRPVPWDFDESFPVDPENSTCAASRATWRCNPEILKVLKLKPNVAQAVELLGQVASSGNVEFFRSILQQVPIDQTNSTPRGSSETLERVVARWAHRELWPNTPTNKGEEENLECMRLLLDRGARWNPAPEELRQVRRSLGEHDPRYIVQVLRLLLYTANAADIESILKLCDSTSFRAKIAQADPPLLAELKALRKHHKQMAA